MWYVIVEVFLIFYWELGSISKFAVFVLKIRKLHPYLRMFGGAKSRTCQCCTLCTQTCYVFRVYTIVASMWLCESFVNYFRGCFSRFIFLTYRFRNARVLDWFGKWIHLLVFRRWFICELQCKQTRLAETQFEQVQGVAVVFQKRWENFKVDGMWNTDAKMTHWKTM